MYKEQKEGEWEEKEMAHNKHFLKICARARTHTHTHTHTEELTASTKQQQTKRKETDHSI